MSRALILTANLVVVFACCFVLPSAEAQLPPSSSTTSTPVPGVGHDYLGEIGETVNPATGSTSIRVKTMMPPGRGLTLPFSFAYDSNGVNYISLTSNGTLGWKGPGGTIVSMGGWTETAPIVTISQIKWTAYNDLSKPVPCFAYVNYMYQDPEGGRHNLNISIYNDVKQSGPCTQDTTHWPVGFEGLIVTQAGEDWDMSGPILGAIPDTTNGSPVTVTQPDGTIFFLPRPPIWTRWVRCPPRLKTETEISYRLPRPHHREPHTATPTLLGERYSRIPGLGAALKQLRSRVSMPHTMWLGQHSIAQRSPLQSQRSLDRVLIFPIPRVGQPHLRPSRPSRFQMAKVSPLPMIRSIRK